MTIKVMSLSPATSHSDTNQSKECLRWQATSGPHHLQKAVMQFPAHWRATPTWMCPEILFIKNRIGDTQRQKESDLEKEPKDSFCWSTEVELPWGVTPYPPQDFHRSPGPGPKNTCRLPGPIKNPCEYGVGALFHDQDGICVASPQSEVQLLLWLYYSNDFPREPE